MGRSIDARWRNGIYIAAVAFLGGFVASQCTQGVSARSSAVDTRPIDHSIDVSTYNCAGLAFRSYRYMSLEEVRQVLGRCRPLPRADAACPPGWVKIWAWEYDLHKETQDGQASPPRRDGHVVAGRTSRIDGTGPERVYSKYAGGEILGPGEPQSWSLPRRELIGSNVAGRKVFAVRENVTVRWYCAPAEKLPRWAAAASETQLSRQ